jgi:DNA replication protein DnaC
VTAQAPPLAPDIAAGLRRLKLATMRQLAPELLVTAKTQRWAPEELLRTLIDAEITARDASNAATRMKTAAFPVIKTLDELDRSACSGAWSRSPACCQMVLVRAPGVAYSIRCI